MLGTNLANEFNSPSFTAAFSINWLITASFHTHWSLMGEGTKY